MKRVSVFCMGVLVLLAGCGGPGRNLPATVPAQGVVTLDGQAVEGAVVNFIADQGEYHATAMTDASGRFELEAFPEKKGAVPGSYKVEVSKTIVKQGAEAAADEEAGPVNISSGLPDKYASFPTSGLTQTIPESGVTDIKIELTSK